MTRSRKLRILTGASLAALAVLGVSAPLAAQQVQQAPSVYSTRASTSGHFHEGELGELALVLERNLKCNCSCGLDVHSCQFQMQCDVSPRWSQRVRESLEAGQTPDAIEAGFVADFGATVLLSPPAEGFNLVGYLLPSVAIVTAGMFIGLFLRGRTGRREGLEPVTELSDEDAGRLKAALRRLDETEGPDW